MEEFRGSHYTSKFLQYVLKAHARKFQNMEGTWLFLKMQGATTWI